MASWQDSENASTQDIPEEPHELTRQQDANISAHVSHEGFVKKAETLATLTATGLLEDMAWLLTTVREIIKRVETNETYIAKLCDFVSSLEDMSDTDDDEPL